MDIPLVDLKAQYAAIREEIDTAVHRVMERGEFILGSEVEAFEKEMAAYLGAKYAVGVASGTEALQLALLACGIGPGDEVVTTPFTFIATAEAITQCGATPVFVDIDRRTYNLNPQKLAELLQRKLSPQSPVPSHRKVGSIGDAGCLSFFPSKVLGAYGDGGMVMTNNREIAEKVKMLRNHGCREKYYHLLPGFNSRLDALQAAILRVKLRHVDDWIRLRQEKASCYAQLLEGVDGIELPYVGSGSEHVFNYYTIRVRALLRDKLREYLSSQGIATAIYYPLSLHLQEVYRSLGYQPGDFPESERAQEEVLSLPMYPEMSEEEIERIAKEIKNKIETRTESDW